MEPLDIFAARDLEIGSLDLASTRYPKPRYRVSVYRTIGPPLFFVAYGLYIMSNQTPPHPTHSVFKIN